MIVSEFAVAVPLKEFFDGARVPSTLNFLALDPKTCFTVATTWQVFDVRRVATNLPDFLAGEPDTQLDRLILPVFAKVARHVVPVENWTSHDPVKSDREQVAASAAEESPIVSITAMKMARIDILHRGINWEIRNAKHRNITDVWYSTRVM